MLVKFLIKLRFSPPSSLSLVFLIKFLLLLDLINFKLFKCLINFWNCENHFDNLIH